MKFRYYLDPDTEEPHIYYHGVTEPEVEQVLHGPGEVLAGAGDSRIKLGQTAAGRFLKIVYVPDNSRESVFIITAYELKGKAKTAFRRRRKRKPK